MVMEVAQNDQSPLESRGRQRRETTKGFAAGLELDDFDGDAGRVVQVDRQ